MAQKLANHQLEPPLSYYVYPCTTFEIYCREPYYVYKMTELTLQSVMTLSDIESKTLQIFATIHNLNFIFS